MTRLWNSNGPSSRPRGTPGWTSESAVSPYRRGASSDAAPAPGTAAAKASASAIHGMRMRVVPVVPRTQPNPGRPAPEARRRHGPRSVAAELPLDATGGEEGVEVLDVEHLAQGGGLVVGALVVGTGDAVADPVAEIGGTVAAGVRAFVQPAGVVGAVHPGPELLPQRGGAWFGPVVHVLVDVASGAELGDEVGHALADGGGVGSAARRARCWKCTHPWATIAGRLSNSPTTARCQSPSSSSGVPGARPNISTPIMSPVASAVPPEFMRPTRK